MHVHWLEQTETDIPSRNDWLCSREAERAASFRIPKRRADWLLGRWAAKKAVASYLSLPTQLQALAAIEIRPALSGAPEVFVSDKPSPVAISLSHRAGRALCALAPIDAILGCDLEAIEAHSGVFIADYFTSKEQRVIACAPSHEQQRTIALLWSAKESTLKALHEGLRIDTRAVNVRFEVERRDTEGWAPLHACHSGQDFHGWWNQEQNFVRTIISRPASLPPVRLEPVSVPPDKALEVSRTNGEVDCAK